MSNLAGVQIHRLVLRGDTRNKATLLASLDMQCWPGEDDPRIIFIKRLQVKSPWWTLARELAQECDAEYRAATSATNASDTSNAIVFTSEAQLIAQLLINLRYGQSPWYQQSWLTQAQLAAEPIAVLLYRPALIPEILQQLYQQQQLAPLFAHCSEKDLRSLVEQVQVFLAIHPVLFTRTLEASAENFLAVNEQPVVSAAQRAWVKTWLPPLVQMHSAPAQQLALQLLVCLGLWKFSPQQLHQSSAWVLWFQVLSDSARAMKLSITPLQSNTAFAAETSEQIADAQHTIIANKATESTAAGSMNTKPADMGDSKKNLLPQTTSTAEFNTQHPASQSHVAQAAIAEITQDLESGSGALLDYRYIRHAGFLYLFNWLRDYPALINLPAPLSPWLWLAHFYMECCAAWQLPPDKALQQVLLDISGLDETEFYQSASLFQGTGLQAARLYLQARLEKFQIDNYAWMDVPARVWVEQGYVQIYIHESCVRIALRLAGLDINPGWVPSLGRVIQFHFGHYPELFSQVVSSAGNQVAEGGLRDE